MITLNYIPQEPIPELTVGTLKFKRKNSGVWLGSNRVQGSWYVVCDETSQLLDELLKEEVLKEDIRTSVARTS